MMSNKLRAVLENTIDSTLIDKVQPETDYLAEILSMKSMRLSTMVDTDLSRSIFALAQYQVFLQSQVNIRNIKYLDIKRKYEWELARLTTLQEGKTIKEKTARVLENNKELQALAEELSIAEADYRLLEGIPESVLELSNAMKKELSLRVPQFRR